MRKSLLNKLAGLLVLAVLSLPSVVAAEEYRVVKGDVLRLSVFQWPEYSGESRVDDLGAISLPALGRLTVNGLTLEAIEQRIIAKLSSFSEIPNVRVIAEVVEYRPFSVLGAVSDPGRYPYASSMTVLDAVAVAGGFLTPRGEGDRYKRLVDLTESRERLDVFTFQLWVALARRARLLAESKGLENVEFPEELLEHQTANDKFHFSEREEDIFAARKNSIEKQIDILKQQIKILKTEIKTLEQHRSEIKRSVNFLEQELKNQSSLLDRGLARRLTVITIEKQLTDMQGEYRQSVVSTMKARKDLSDINKEIFLIQNERRAEVSNELISVESQISIFLMRIEYQKSLLYDNVASAFGPTNATGKSAESDVPTQTDIGFEFVLLRGEPGAERSVIREVTESMAIMPGDVLKVLIAR